jgi:hypothetical protein
MAAAAKKSTATAKSSLTFRDKPKKSRKGIHSKTKMSKNKKSKNYVKVSRGQNS